MSPFDPKPTSLVKNFCIAKLTPTANRNSPALGLLARYRNLKSGGNTAAVAFGPIPVDCGWKGTAPGPFSQYGADQLAPLIAELEQADAPSRQHDLPQRERRVQR